ncbi:MAG: hypothetical protein JWP87_5772 [Labilithrix sp.]|jgi:hypothetical protein|nr:hypothetical protein [Labilithrix sp.]
MPRVLVAAAVAIAPACVPTGSAPPYDAGAQPTAAATFKPSLNVMTAPFEDNFDRPDAVDGGWAAFDQPGADSGTANAAGADSGKADGGGLALLNRDSGLEGGADADGSTTADAGPKLVDRSNLGPNWVQIKTNAWRVEGGKLCVQNAHNHGVWLNRTLPINARIEFDATGYSDDGDLKTEVWGDGTSYATGTSYTNATSYLAVLGGWKNSLHVLARLNEHGSDRKEIHVDKDSDDPRQRPAQKGQTYHFKIERNDGKTVRWSVDGIDFLTWNDPAPLAGQGHDHFGFNEWEAKVCFDNVKVTPL